MNLLDNIIIFHQFQPGTVIYLVIVIVLLFFSAMVSGSETSMFALTQTQIESIRKRNSRSDQAIVKLLGTQDYMLATILIVNNLISICIVIVTNYLIDTVVAFGSLGWEFAVKTVVVTFMLLLFGDIMPKIYAAYSPLKFAHIVAVPLLSLNRIMRPFSWLLIRSSSRINETVARKKVNLSIDELSNAMKITRNQTREERRMLSGIVKFVNTKAGEIKKQRMEMVALDMAKDFSAVRRTITDSGFSRIPVYAGTIDNIKGILHVRDMIPFIDEKDGFEWQRHLHRAYFVPEHKKINDLLEEFRAKRIQMAIVVDEYGATQGLVSLEDIIEEIVGEITDESERAGHAFYRKIDDSTYMFDGRTHLLDLEKIMGIGENYFADVSGGSETLAGLLIELKRDFLKKGENISAKGISFTVAELDGRRIDKVRVRIDKRPHTKKK